MDDTLSILASLIWVLALGMWPVGVFFAGCSPCCESQCPWLIEFDRCLRYRVIGSSPEVGGDCRVRSTQERTGEIRVGIGFSDTVLSISQEQSRISVPVTVTIPGLSQRTPVGEERTERFRFNRPPWNAPVSFDVLGPPWHLEVEITVRGVASQQEQSVESSLDEDEHGQPKLVLDIKQWNSTVTHTQVVTLNPIGAQRVPGRFSLGIPPFSLQDASSTAARVGTTTFPWTVVRGSVSIIQKSLVVRVAAACSRGVPQSFICDDANVSAFLSGTPRQFSDIEITITPDNAVCGIPADRVGVGIALGVYPERLYLEVGQPLASQLCHSTHEMLASGEVMIVSCPSRWQVRPYRGKNGRDLISQSSLDDVRPSVLWAGESLLWNLEKGHYRSSAQVELGIVRITQPGGALPDRFNYTNRLSTFVVQCPPGFGSGFNSIDGQPVCLPDIPIEGGRLQSLVPTPNGYAIRGTSFGGTTVQAFLGPVNLCDLPRTFEGLTTVPLGLSVPPFLMTLPARELCSPWDKTTISVDGDTVTRSCYRVDASGNYLSPTTNQQVQIAPNLSRLARKFFLRFPGFGSPDDHSYEAQLFSQQGRCRLFGVNLVTWLSGSGSLLQIIENSTGVWGMAAGDCLHFALNFGEKYDPESPGENCIGFAQSRDSLPCDGCTPSVTVISGSENADVRYNPTGERSRLIDVIAKRTWLGGQGVSFRVTCGNDTITPTIRRANTAPEPPVQLAATRDTCDTVTLTWTEPHDGGSPITNYTIQYNAGGDWTTLVRPASTATSAAVPGLLRVGYEFRVFATNSVGDGLPSSVTAGFALGPPTNLVATRGPCDQVALSWTPPAQSECIVVASYQVQFSVAGMFSWATFTTVAGNVTAATVTGLSPTTAYDFRVLRIDEAGFSAGHANVVLVGAAPPAPANVVAVAGDTQATITWEGGEDACVPNTNHTVQFRLTTTSTWSTFGNTGSAAKSATVTGLTNGLQYVFRVRANNSLGVSPDSAASNVVTPTA